MGVVISMFISHLCFTQDLQKYNPERELIEGVVIPNTELFKIHSDITGEDFLIYVQLPMSYKQNQEKLYPVWYNTDANRGFPFVANAVTFLTFPPGDIPEMVVIGIGYLTKGLEDWAAFRTRDLTPTNNPETDEYWTRMISDMSGRKDIKVHSGGASQFIHFIEKELIPYVESEYRVDPENRTLGGYSYGGLFTLYTLFKSPGLFHKYFAGSPSLHYDNEILFSYENEYAELHQDINAELFITAGGLEENLVDEVIRIKNRLLSRDYPSLDLTVQIFENENHRSCVGAAFFRAINVLHMDE
jgi:predicted alpha/beta superfamily hydrolase